jgi:cytochrome c
MRLHTRSVKGSVVAVVAALISIVPDAARSETALSPEAQRGLAIVRALPCSGESRTKPVGPLKAAPPFRTLHSRYPVESLEESLAEGIVIGHPAMPEFQFDSEQVGEVIAYLKSLEH